MCSFFAGKRVLITGGTGSIGRALAKTLLNSQPAVIRILSNDENGLFEMEQEFKGNSRLRFLLGDMRDKDRLMLALRDIDIVFHAAALKHVPISEYNPFEIVQTNVLGTQSLLEASIWRGIEKFILISTDKAVNPTSTLGASKLLCERLVLDAASYRGTKPTAFSCVRFGNVLGSRGSVTNIFTSQVATGGPVTVTDKRMTRFIMLPEEAVRLVLLSAEICRGSEIFVLKMKGVRIMDLAQAMIDEFAPSFGRRPESIRIEETGMRPGEKLDEELMTQQEANRSLESSSLFVILPSQVSSESYQGFTPAKLSTYSSDSVRQLTYDELRKLCVRIPRQTLGSSS